MQGFVYFVRCRHFVKVGYAIDVQSRLAELQCGCPYELEVMASMEGPPSLERIFHRALWKRRLRGEWFKLNNDFVGLIDAIKGGARPATHRDVQMLFGIQRDMQKARKRMGLDERRYAEVYELNRGR